MNFLWLATLVCLSSNLVTAQELEQREARRRLCGTLLADTLALVCEGAYNVQFGKRDGSGSNELQGDGYDYEQMLFSEPAWPFLSRQAANSLLQRDDYHRRFRRDSRGVVDECCYKSCSVRTLKSYCANKKA